MKILSDGTHRSFKSLKNKRVLLTCGPTWVAIDDMRVISNRSSGELGHILAMKLKQAKAKVTLVQGPVTHQAQFKGIRILKFCFFDELLNVLRNELTKKYDVVIHAAAVSDFQLKQKFNGKIQSDRMFKNAKSSLRLELKPTPKLIHLVKQLCPNTFLVGFKLEDNFNNTSLANETQQLFQKDRCDLVIANFYNDKKYEAFIVDSRQTLLGKVKSKTALANLLLNILKDRL